MIIEGENRPRVLPKSLHWSHDLLGRAEDWYESHKGWRRFFASGKEKHQAIIDKGAGLALQNPRQKDVRKSIRRIRH